jgi:hypothetical protein
MENPEGIVAVSIDPDSLYEKMTTRNLRVCANCLERTEKFGELNLAGGDWFRCPRAEGGISLCESTHLPKECPNKFRHIIAQTVGRKEKNPYA